MNRGSRALAATVATCGLAAIAPVTAGAAPTVSKLRVEAGGRALDSGTSYVNDTARVSTAKDQCGGTGRSYTAQGPTPAGLVQHARNVRAGLRPFYVSDAYYGSGRTLIVCRIGAFGAFGSQAWLYKVDHRVILDEEGQPPKAAPNQYPLERGDEVLWYFADFGSGRNTGDELALRTPARVRPNRPFAVRAVAYDWEGNATPAKDVAISGDATAVTDANGWATVKAPREGRFRLRARRGNDIPAAPTRTCVDANLDRCPAVRGEQIFGTGRGDAIPGTAGADTVIARGGDDRVYVGRGGPDAVSCGGGIDSVRASGNDRVARDCERVVRV